MQPWIHSGLHRDRRVWERKFLGFKLDRQKRIGIAPESPGEVPHEGSRDVGQPAERHQQLAEARGPIYGLEGWVRRHMRKCFWQRWHGRAIAKQPELQRALNNAVRRRYGFSYHQILRRNPRHSTRSEGLPHLSRDQIADRAVADGRVKPARACNLELVVAHTQRGASRVGSDDSPLDQQDHGADTLRQHRPVHLNLHVFPVHQRRVRIKQQSAGGEFDRLTGSLPLDPLTFHTEVQIVVKAVSPVSAPFQTPDAWLLHFRSLSDYRPFGCT